MESLYCSYIHTYLNDAYLTWGSTNETKQDKLMIYRKRALRIINNKSQFYQTKELFQSQ